MTTKTTRKGATIDAGSLAHHLRVAAEQYKRDAAGARELIEGDNTSFKRLAAQFDAQAAQASDFAMALDAGSMKVDGDQLRVVLYL